ncbi:MAG: glycosyl hydrolase [Flavobacteriia bacterium]|nr:glycosyl hydrolase [Flavobacteriia bacterium]
MKKSLLLLTTLCIATVGYSQSEEDWYMDDIRLSGLSFRNIGPATTSGRIADLAVNPNNSSEYYVAAASGGVWKTSNHGVSFSPIFDGQGSYSIGCITIDPNNSNVLWVGTGENNNQRSVAYGDGLYKSEDGGRSWNKVGLENSEHIGMIAVDPRNSDVVYVAAYGPLWSEGGDRGLYKTTDGGETWNKVLEISEHTGVNEVHLDPRNPDVVYATAHQRRRHVWTYISGGPESAIYKSTNGGESFDKLAGGLPSGDVGRIGMDISPVNPDVLYACIEGHGFYRSMDRGASWSMMSDHETSGNYYVEIFASPHDVNTVYSMDTYAAFTTDGGKNFNRVPERGKHVDNHAMWIDPNDANHFLMGCDGGLYETWDNASTWHFKPNLPITQFYRVAVDNAEPFYFVYGGTQDNFSLGGPSRTTHDRGIVNSDWFVTNTGDGFESQVDPLDPNIVYAQAQYGWLVRYDKLNGETVPIKPDVPRGEAPLRWNWDAPLLISPHDNKTLYFAANRVFKSTDRGNSWSLISPDLSQQIDRNELPVMGQVWSIDAIAKNKSTTIYGNIVSLTESPLAQGLIYVGTDDGLIQVTDNDGQNWTRYNTFPGVPANTYVNDLDASQHDDNVVYAVFNNHKNGDFKPYVMKSADRGKSWTNITANLPERGSVYALAEDHEDPNLLFVGTEFGVYFTNDGGAHWKKLSAGLPTIAIRDIDIQKRENDLVLASFGRGFYVLDDYSPLRHMSEDAFDGDATVFPIKDGLAFMTSNPIGYGAPGFLGASYYMAENPPVGATFTYYIAEAAKTLSQERKEAEKEMEVISYPSAEEIRAEDRFQSPYLTFVIRDMEGNEIRRMNTSDGSGVRRFTWDGRVASNGYLSTGGAPTTNSGTVGLAPEGTYSVQIYRTVNGETAQLSDAVQFELTHLSNGSIQGDAVEIAAFQREVDKAYRDLNAIGNELDRQMEVVGQLEAAIRNTPGAPMELLADLRTLSNTLEDMNIEINGDASLTKKEFETPTSLGDILGITAWGSYSTTSGVTQTQRDGLSTVQAELSELVQSLQTSGDQLLIIKQQAYDAGAPYLEGDLPQQD